MFRSRGSYSAVVCEIETYKPNFEIDDDKLDDDDVVIASGGSEDQRTFTPRRNGE